MAKSHRATFLKRKKWWVGWSEDVPGALTQGKTLTQAKANLRDAIRLMQKHWRTGCGRSPLERRDGRIRGSFFGTH